MATASWNGTVLAGTASCYPDPEPEAARIRSRVACWKGVEVTD